MKQFKFGFMEEFYAHNKRFEQPVNVGTITLDDDGKPICVELPNIYPKAKLALIEEIKETVNK